MDLNQRKLTKKEWDSIEYPVSANELFILKLITKGYHNVDIVCNNTLSLLAYMKIIPDAKNNIDMYLFDKYLKPQINDLCKKYKLDVKSFIKIEKKKGKSKKKEPTVKKKRYYSY